MVCRGLSRWVASKYAFRDGWGSFGGRYRFRDGWGSLDGRYRFFLGGEVVCPHNSLVGVNMPPGVNTEVLVMVRIMCGDGERGQ